MRRPKTNPLDLVRLTPLMDRTEGRPEVAIGVIDGPVALDHPHLARQRIRELPGSLPSACVNRDSIACAHATFVTSILSATRDSPAPAICPGCSLLIRPIFPEASMEKAGMPMATLSTLAEAIVDVVDAGARPASVSATVDRRAHDRLARQLPPLDGAL